MKKDKKRIGFKTYPFYLNAQYLHLNSTLKMAKNELSI